MAFEIEWTEPVLQDLKAIVCYLESEWSETIADKFVELIKERVKELSKYPYIGMASGNSPAMKKYKNFKT